MSNHKSITFTAVMAFALLGIIMLLSVYILKYAKPAAVSISIEETDSLVLRTSHGWWLRINRNGSGNYGFGTMIDRVEVRQRAFDFDRVYKKTKKAAAQSSYKGGPYVAVSYYLPKQSSAQEHYLTDYFKPVSELFSKARINALPPSNEFEVIWHKKISGIWEKSPPVFEVEDALIDETDPDKICKTDDDCWCASFTGAEFIPGKTPSRCCDKEDWACKEAGRCARCFYE